MQTIRGSFQDGVAKPDEPVQGHEGEPVLITFLSNGETDDASTGEAAEDDDFPTLEEVVARIRALGPSEGYIPPTRRLSELPPPTSDEWDRQWAEIEAEMKWRDLENDRAEGLI
jgi:hypothetical protein